ncbi:hypothetical protein C0Q44_02575 [Paenibacillus sp. PCH8]|nr:hypothetical protein C0Q44_02575 [Paenibacillus sp. PCH8]
MILNYIDTPLDGKSWESLMNSCYRMKFQDEHFTEIPAIHGGDAGIEGFTRQGRVYQCYCPEREYSDDDLYGHLRTKMTTDIKKLTNLTYAKRLKDLGVPKIKEWHFVIPLYRDARIVTHAETKRQEVLMIKRADPQKYDYIDDEFIIVIKQAEDFKVEISRIVRTTLSDMKLNLAIYHTSTLDWSECDSEKVNNIKRKVKAVMGDVDESDEDYIDVVGMYVDFYMKGIEILKKLRVSYPEIYEDIYVLEQAYKKQVSMRTKMNTDSSINAKLFNEILDDFQQRLEQQFTYLTLASVMELKNDLVSGWLADCSMQFRSR